jgi:hypothetical protein
VLTDGVDRHTDASTITKEAAVSRIAYFSAHAYDWGWMLPKPRPALDVHAHARLFGVGFDLTWSQCQRYYALSLGARWLINIGVGWKFDTTAEFAHMNQTSRWNRASRYLALTLFNLELDIGKTADEPVHFRLFFRGRRLFYKRPA